jgi:hypothetical protein
MNDCEAELKARDHLILLERGASPATAPSKTGIHSLILQHPIDLMLCEQGAKVLRLDYPGSWAGWGSLSSPGDMTITVCAPGPTSFTLLAVTICSVGKVNGNVCIDVYANV